MHSEYENPGMVEKYSQVSEKRFFRCAGNDTVEKWKQVQDIVYGSVAEIFGNQTRTSGDWFEADST